MNDNEIEKPELEGVALVGKDDVFKDIFTEGIVGKEHFIPSIGYVRLKGDPVQSSNYIDKEFIEDILVLRGGKLLNEKYDNLAGKGFSALFIEIGSLPKPASEFRVYSTFA